MSVGQTLDSRRKIYSVLVNQAVGILFHLNCKKSRRAASLRKVKRKSLLGDE